MYLFGWLESRSKNPEHFLLFNMQILHSLVSLREFARNTLDKFSQAKEKDAM